jgi:hypothetical protein
VEGKGVLIKGGKKERREEGKKGRREKKGKEGKRRGKKERTSHCEESKRSAGIRSNPSRVTS